MRPPQGAEWVILLGMASTALVVVALIVALVGRASRRSQPPAAPQGWYPDPSGAGRRWWDGTRWTEHTAP